MTAQDHPFSLVARLRHTFDDWLKLRRELSEMRLLDTAEFDRIASDLRVSRPIWTNWSAAGRMRLTNCRGYSRRWGSARRTWRGSSRWSCTTWSASVRSAESSANATAIWRVERQPSIIRNTASTRRRSRPWATRRINKNPACAPIAAGHARRAGSSPEPQSSRRWLWCALPCPRAAVPPSDRRARSRRARHSREDRMQR
jgi:hypothetical protein